MRQRARLLSSDQPKTYEIEIQFGQNQRAVMTFWDPAAAYSQLSQLRSSGIFHGSWINSIEIREFPLKKSVDSD